MAAAVQLNNSDVEDSDSSSTGESGESNEVSDVDNVDLNPIWSNITAGMKRILFTGENKLKQPTPVDNNPVDWFFLLVDDIFLENICTFTNAYALDLFCGPSIEPNSRINKFQDLTVPELKIFLGLLLHMGSIRLNRYQDYWKTDRLYNIPIFRQYMSRDRFLIIMRCICFSKSNHPNAADRLHKVSFLVDYFNNKMSWLYSPGKELSLDEGMILWRGRLQFRQYIKGKRHKYGIKLYTLSEPEGLCLHFLVYSGKNDLLGGKGHTSKVVFHLMRDFLYKGHSIYMDNYYNSFELSSKLLSCDTYTTGTLRPDRKYNPVDVIKANLDKGETKSQYSEGVMVGRWRDKRYVLYISTEFENNMATVINKRRQEQQKPLPIIQYNAHMKGVDRGDQMLSYYPCEHKSIRWYKKVFVHVIQMLVVNSLALYNMHNVERKKKSLYDFRNELIGALLPPKPEMSLRTPQRNILHTLVKNETRMASGVRARKRCKVCTANGREKKTVYVCSACPGNAAFCPIECFDNYHKRM